MRLMERTMLEEFNQVRQQAMIAYAISQGKWLYIEYTDQKHQFTARLVKPIKFLPVSVNGPGFLARCELREVPYRHFKLGSISKMIVVDNLITWEE